MRRACGAAGGCVWPAGAWHEHGMAHLRAGCAGGGRVARQAGARHEHGMACPPSGDETTKIPTRKRAGKAAKKHGRVARFNLQKT